MSILLTTTIGFLSVFWGHHLFKKWFNHLSIYSLIWMGMIVLYELKLLPFNEISLQTWFVTLGAYFSFLLGILTIISARSVFPQNKIEHEPNMNSFLFLDKGKKIRFFLILFSLIGLFSSIQHWNILLSQYGSIGNVILHSQEIYNSRLQGEEVKGVIPYIWLFSYFGIFLGGLYSAYKGRITLISLIPVLAVVLKETARFTRSGILLGLMEFVISFMLARHLFSGSSSSIKSRLRIILTTSILLIITVLAATAVKISRNPIDTYKGSASSISQFKTGAIISPSVYFYAASQIGVFNIYLREDNEQTQFGNSTFFTVYNILSKFGVAEKPKIFQRGYFIPYWSNTATYLRDLYSDFGILGPLIVPFLIGMLATFYWFRFYESKKFIYHVILTHLFILVAISFFTLATRFTPWVYGFLILTILIPLIERINFNRYSN